MAYRPVLTVDIEYEDATFTFTSPDEAMSRVVAIGQRCHAEGMSKADIETNAPADLLQAIVAVFVDGVIAWEGVEGEDSFLACNGGTKRRIPFTDKVAVANLYIERMTELQVGKAASAEAGMSTMPPEAPADDSTKASSGSASAKPTKAEAAEE